MSGLAVAIGPYSADKRSRRDGSDLEIHAFAGRGLTDAGLIGGTGDRRETVHRYLARYGQGYRAVASALVDALWPPALLAGATAGGAGTQVLTCFAKGLTVGASRDLGRVSELVPAP